MVHLYENSKGGSRMKIIAYNYGITGTPVNIRYFRTFINFILLPVQFLFSKKIKKLREEAE